ncbi:MAG: DNA topoisomerase IV subunit A [Rhodospirillaceae bacterium]|nr:DNA topoisomerase IV subunit A [Rhodospirillaceae bacterium]|tara:strand:+ start:3191 stop:5416 length:2226 start_codon:yes stop_codon:yes gene_type:complete
MSNNTISGSIREEPFKDALGERYLSYAVSTIMSRSLPDVRDGLKPVHRRLLYAMMQLRLDPEQGYKKCARVVGDVMGKFHPHGDQAIYDALVRLAQDFSVRYPLIDGQGNFGNVDGDNAAAMRYTESRLTEIAVALLDGIDDDAVNFRDTYDGDSTEPIVLPANFPNLLANGASGIAVGMASSIPPHNLSEICDSLLYLLKTPNASIEKLISFMPGPDFPTGGILIEDSESITETYKTGRGNFRVRAKWEIEDLGRGQYQIIVSEIPYLVQKSRLTERIADLIHNRKLVFLGDVRDESAEDIRLVLEPKNRNVNPEILMESLFRLTDLETRFSMNMNVIDSNQTPRVMSLREVLQAYIDHRLDVLVRRTDFKLNKIHERLKVLEGYIIVYLNLDEVIEIIREDDNPKLEMKNRWKLNDIQADAILNMRLRSLRKLEEVAIKKEIASLKIDQKQLKQILNNRKARIDYLSSEISDLKKKYGYKSENGIRKTLVSVPQDLIHIPLEATIEREQVTVVCSQKNWIRCIKGHNIDHESLKYKEGDSGSFVINAETTDKLLVFASNGRFYTIGVDKLPGGRGHGEPLNLMIDLGNDNSILALIVHNIDKKLFIASSDGRGFVVLEKDVIAQTRSGKQVLNIHGNVKAKICVQCDGDRLAVIGENRKLLVFPTSDLPIMTRGRGIKLQSYSKGGLSSAKIFTLEEGLTVRTGSRKRKFEREEIIKWEGKRAQAGRLPPTGFPRTNKL